MIKQNVAKSSLHVIFETSTSCSWGIIEKLLEQFGEINAQDENGNTPLMVLIDRAFNLPAFVMQNTTGENNRYSDSEDSEHNENNEEANNTTVDEIDWHTIIENLIVYEGYDPNVQNNAGDTALHFVCRHYHIGALDAMIGALNSFKLASPYCVVAFKLIEGTDHVEQILVFIYFNPFFQTVGAIVTHKNNLGESPLDYAPTLMYHYQDVYPLLKDYVMQEKNPATNL